MEFADVELAAQSFLGFGTDGGNLELADFIGESLSWQCNLPIDLQACARLARHGYLNAYRVNTRKTLDKTNG